MKGFAGKASRRLAAVMMTGLGLLALVPTRPARADVAVAMGEENDVLPTGSDRHYTQGLLLSLLGPPLQRGGWLDRRVDALGRVLPMFAGDADASVQRRIEFMPLAQSIFTPRDLSRPMPDPKDRPYAGWLYGGFGLLQENGGDRVHDLELLLGVVGPSAIASNAQDVFHNVLGLHDAAGYDHQLADRAALQLSYTTLRRVALGAAHGIGFDVVPEAGFAVGSVYRDLEAGALLRLGTGLDADYGPQRVRPALSGTALRHPRAGGVRYSVFTGLQLRYVDANSFIDRAVEVAPMALSRRPWVADFYGGCTLYLGRRFNLDFTATRRTREFVGQQASDVFGSLRLSATF